MKITLQTLVKDAVDSCDEAVELFIRHGINPTQKCSGMYDMVTLEDAQEWCKIEDLDALIAELNAAMSGNE